MVTTFSRRFNKAKKRSKAAQAGFTLIELTVVTAIAGVLGTIAVPMFLDARAVASTKGAVGGVTGIARECASWISAGGGASGMTPPSVAVDASTSITCSDAAGATTAFEQEFGGRAAAGIKCMADTSANTDTKVTMTVDEFGGMTCLFS